MHHAPFVRCRKGLGDANRYFEHAGDGQPARCDEIRKALALDQFHGEESDVVLVLDREQRDDAWMVERGHGAGLPLEAEQVVGVARDGLGQHLERHFATQAKILGTVHLTHPAGAERADDLVGAEVGARGQWHASKATTLKRLDSL